jgi:hypothetical protein
MRNNIIFLLFLLGINYFGKCQTPLDSFRFLKDILIQISEDGKTGWILKNTNEVNEVNLPSFEMKNKISLNLTK